MMRNADVLLWHQTADIAAALSVAYPDCDRLRLSKDDIINYVRQLHNFADPAVPDQRQLDHILWTWMRLSGVRQTEVAQMGDSA